MFPWQGVYNFTHAVITVYFSKKLVYHLLCAMLDWKGIDKCLGISICWLGVSTGDL